MIGEIIGGAMQIGGAIAGGISASRAAKKQKEAVEEQRRKNQDWYDQRYNENTTQRADAVYMLNQTREYIKNRNRAAAGSAAVMGGTDESVAAAKAANNAALADATAQIVAQGEARKDNIEGTYMSNDNAFVNQLNAIEAERANQIKEAAKGVGDAGSKVANAF